MNRGMISFHQMNSITFDPRWSVALGHPIAALIVQRAANLWAANRCQPFVKFIEPCDDRLYERCGSWQEDIGTTPEVIKTNLKKVSTQIGKRRCAQEDVLAFEEASFNEAGQCLEACCLLYYHVDFNRVTHWYINEPLYNNLYDHVNRRSS